MSHYIYICVYIYIYIYPYITPTSQNAWHTAQVFKRHHPGKSAFGKPIIHQFITNAWNLFYLVFSCCKPICGFSSATLWTSRPVDWTGVKGPLKVVGGGDASPNTVKMTSTFLTFDIFAIEIWFNHIEPCLSVIQSRGLEYVSYILRFPLNYSHGWNS